MPLLGPATAACLAAGVVACLALPLPLPTIVWLGCLLLALPCILVPRLRAPAAFLLGIAVAGAHVQHALSIRLPASPLRHDVAVVGRVGDLPRREGQRLSFHFDVDPGSHPLAGRSLRLSWNAPRGGTAPRIAAGERWRLQLRLRAPRGLRNPGAPDSEKRAFADRIAAVGSVRAGARVAAADGLPAWRERTSAAIQDAVEVPSSRFIRALALGDTRHLGDDDWATLRSVGLTHLIAISGFHVGMVAGAAALLARLLWWCIPALARRWPARSAAAAAGAGMALAYAAASGFSLPTVRTLLMIAVVAAAGMARRPVSTVQALALATIAVLLVDPLSVLSPGFWLSFVGVAWLLWCMPRSSGAPVRELVQAQVVASIGLLPLTVVLFAQASIAGPFANLIAVPLWSLVVAPLAVAGIALDAIHPVLGALAWQAAA